MQMLHCKGESSGLHLSLAITQKPMQFKIVLDANQAQQPLVHGDVVPSISGYGQNHLSLLNLHPSDIAITAVLFYHQFLQQQLRS